MLIAIPNNWTHPSIDRAPMWRVSNYRVLQGSVVRAWLRPNGKGWHVITPAGYHLGSVESRAQAMLMTMRDHEGATQ